MKKFAFLVHLRNNYKEDLSVLHPAFGAVPEKFYRLFRRRPFSPFIWSEVKITPGSSEADGYIIMLPYVAGQLLNQRKFMMPIIKKALKIAAGKGAAIVGLGALTSPITSGGKMLLDNPFTSITNGNAFTAVITFQKTAELIALCPVNKPVVAIVGATGSVGSLVSQLLVKNSLNAGYLLVARNEHRLTGLATLLGKISPFASINTSRDLLDIASADIVVLLTSASDFLLKTEHLKKNAVVLDDTQPRNTHPDLLKERNDIKIIDGGLVSIPGLRFQRHIGLPSGLSYACLAETILLNLSDHEGHFSIGNPTLEQAEYIRELAQNHSHLGFELAIDHTFGKVLV